jgi:hypothetical protein
MAASRPGSDAARRARSPGPPGAREYSSCYSRRLRWAESLSLSGTGWVTLTGTVTVLVTG